jgi:hypothetical protein
MKALAGGILATAATCVTLAPGSLAARQAPRAVAAQATVTGEITRLGLARISVGRIGCAIPPRLEASAGRFVITDPVKIACLNGKLRSVRYWPEVATAQTSRAGGGDAPTTVPAPPPGGAATGPVKSVYTIVMLYLGGPPPGDTTTVTGTIDDLSSTAVTVAGLTCSFRSIPTPGTPLAGPQVGDDVTLTCTGGYLIRLASVGAVSH